MRNWKENNIFFKRLLVTTGIILAGVFFLSVPVLAGDSDGSDDDRPSSKKVRVQSPPPSASSLKGGDYADDEGSESISTALTISRSETKEPMLSVSHIFSELTKKIIGEDDGMRALATYYFRHIMVNKLNEDLEDPIKKVNLLIMGPTGSGKTASLRVLAEIMGVPFFEADASTMTRSGYVGDSVNVALEGLLRAADYNKHRAEEGIVLFDEIDKIAARESSTGRDIAGKDVQSELLKMLEGKKIEVKIPSPLRERKVVIDTSKILFIGAGAFSSLPKKSEPYTIDDLVAAGFMPEFIGRFGRLIQLNGTTEEKLFQILTHEHSSIMRDNFLLLESLGIEANFTEGAARLISKRAFQDGTGVRGLETYVARIVEPLISDHEALAGTEVVIDENYINKHFPVVKKKKEHEPWMNMYS